jgi:hypothetical protein
VKNGLCIHFRSATNKISSIKIILSTVTGLKKFPNRIKKPSSSS